MEKNNATIYIPIQKRKDCQPPIAEKVLALIDSDLVFQGYGFNRYNEFYNAELMQLLLIINS